MVRWVLLFILMMGSAFGDSVTATGRVPLRPSDGIYDKSGWLEGVSRAGMVRNILGVREKGGGSIFVVVLEARPDDADGVAMRWGRNWGEGGLWGLILHVPGEEGFPRFYGELSREPAWGKAEKEEFDKSLEGALQKVELNAVSVLGERQRVELATRVMAEGLGYLGVVMERVDHRFAQARGKPPEPLPSKKSGNEIPEIWWEIGVPLVGLVVLVLLFLLLKPSQAEPMDQFHFPGTEPRKRFRAPWSGGGNVLIEFRQPGKGRRQ